MLPDHFAAAMATLGPFEPNSPIAVALSGGADSMALTMLAHQWSKTSGNRIITLTIDHGLRPESATEAAQVGAWMRTHGIAHHILTPTRDTASNNLQEAAREWRYQALASYCRTHGILHCLVAHHAGDNRETVAHNLARGDTADGASGMRHIRTLHGVRFLRPLLGVSRADLEDCLRRTNMPWVEDPSNQNPRFARVRNRQLLQDDTARVAALDTLVQQESAARSARDHTLAKAAIRSIHFSPLGFADIDRSAWCAHEPALASQLLADCLTTIGGHRNRPRAKDTARLAEVLRAGSGRARTLAHCTITHDAATIRISREAARVEPPILLTGSGGTVWDGRFSVRYDAPTRKSLTMRALGNNGRAQLKRLLPHTAQRTLPLSTPSLWHLDELLFVPHIGMPQEQLHAVRIGFAPPKPLAAAPFW